MTIKALYPNIAPSLLLDFANVENLDPRVTFARASSGAYYNGVTTAKAEENLIALSEQVELWSNQIGVTPTANTTTAPNGTTTADTVAETSATSTHYIENRVAPTISGSTYAISVFLKKGTGATAPDVMQVTWAGGGFATNVFVNYNLSTGAVTSAGAGVLSSSITDAGNGWYRCAFTANATSSVTNSGTSVLFCNNNGSATRAPSYAGATTADVFVWGAQFEQRSAVTAYTPTTTQPITNFVPVLQSAANNVARFDHNPVTGESLGLLIEEQRTNLWLQSQFAGSWTPTRATLQVNDIIAPDGTLTGARLFEDTTATNTHNVGQSISFTSGTTYTVSVFAKATASPRFLQIIFLSGAFGVTRRPVFDLLNGTALAATDTTANIQNIGNGWYRCVASMQATSTSSTSAQLQLADTYTNGVSAYTGDGYSGLYVWGAQLEAGAFPTSYIPTVASQVTRSADAASMTGANFSSWFSNAEGTFYANWITQVAGTGRFLLAAQQQANSGNRFDIQMNTSNIVNPRTILGGAAVVSISGGTYTAGTEAKIGFAFKPTDYASSFNGASPVTSSTAGLLPTPDVLFMGSFSAASSFLNGHIRKLSFYPKRLANAELQALTQI